MVKTKLSIYNTIGVTIILFTPYFATRYSNRHLPA